MTRLSRQLRPQASRAGCGRLGVLAVIGVSLHPGCPQRRHHETRNSRLAFIPPSIRRIRAGRLTPSSPTLRACRAPAGRRPRRSSRTRSGRKSVTRRRRPRSVDPARIAAARRCSLQPHAGRGQRQHIAVLCRPQHRSTQARLHSVRVPSFDHHRVHRLGSRASAFLISTPAGAPRPPPPPGGWIWGRKTHANGPRDSKAKRDQIVGQARILGRRLPKRCVSPPPPAPRGHKPDETTSARRWIGGARSAAPRQPCDVLPGGCRTDALAAHTKPPVPFTVPPCTGPSPFSNGIEFPRDHSTVTAQPDGEHHASTGTRLPRTYAGRHRPAARRRAAGRPRYLRAAGGQLGLEYQTR